MTNGAGWTELAIEASHVDLEIVAELLGEFAPGAVWIEPAIVTSDHRDFTYTVLDEGGTVRAAVAAWGPSERAALEARQPMGRLVSAEEVALAIAYLASPLSGSTTGTALAVDGGMQNLRLPAARS